MTIVVGICLVIAFCGLGIVCFDQYKREIQEEKRDLPEPDLDKLETYLGLEISPAQKTAFMLELLTYAYEMGYEDERSGNPPSSWEPEKDGVCSGNWIKATISRIEDKIKITTNNIVQKNNLMREKAYGLNLLNEIGGGKDLYNNN